MIYLRMTLIVICILLSLYLVYNDRVVDSEKAGFAIVSNTIKGVYFVLLAILLHFIIR